MLADKAKLWRKALCMLEELPQGPGAHVNEYQIHYLPKVVRQLMELGEWKEGSFGYLVSGHRLTKWGHWESTPGIILFIN
jgi:hypothetical protein